LARGGSPPCRLLTIRMRSQHARPTTGPSGGAAFGSENRPQCRHLRPGLDGGVDNRCRCPQGLSTVVDCRQRRPATDSRGRSDHEPGPDRLDRRSHVRAVQRSSLPLGEWHYMRTNEMGRGSGCDQHADNHARGRCWGSCSQIVHSGRIGGIIVTGSVTENLATTATPDRGASAWCRPASPGQTSRHDAPHLQGGG
jgi:hypothetical protein